MKPRTLQLIHYLVVAIATLASHMFSPAQDTRCTIRGTVRDADTGEPVEFANVFLANTTFGTAADAHGAFVISGVPPGSYQLVASRIGYFPQGLSIRCTAGKVTTEKFTLRSRILSAEGLEVSAVSLDEWKKDFSEFQEEFLGSDDFGIQCTIINSDALRLLRETERHELSATSVKALEIVNMALGYRLSVDIESFASRKEEGTVIYEVFNRFEEIQPRDSVQGQQWQANREKAYKGSRMHFLRSVAGGTTEQENFRVYRGELSALRTLRGSYIGPALEGIVTTIDAGLKQLSWDGYLRVEYRGEEGWTNNIFRLTRTPIFLESSGLMHDPTAFVVLTDSPWGRDRLGRMLPLNYGQ